MNNKRILLVTQPGDLHAFAIHEALKRKGVYSILWHTSDFPSRASESIYVSATQQELRMKGPELDIHKSDFGVILFRRPALHLPEDQIHPADREYAIAACRVFRNSLWKFISRKAFCVNPPNSEARCDKVLQQMVASRHGLEIAETLYSNDPDEIRSFIKEHRGVIAFKSINPPLMWQDSDTIWHLHTTLVGLEQLVEDEILRVTPSIYQAVVQKDYELRVTVIGRHIFSAKLHSQETHSGKIDWRKAGDDIKIESHDLPPEVAAACLGVMEELCIVFGCFDFVVTPDGDYVFLEVNQMGQFLFVERHTHQRLLDAFSEMLIQGTSNFDWEERRSTVSYLDIAPLLKARIEEAHHTHVRPPLETWKEDPTLPSL